MTSHEYSISPWRTSSYSNAGSGDCVEVSWRTSSYSNANSGNCVEVALGAVAAVRDSKDRAGGRLRVPAPAWAGFVTAVRER